MQRDVKGEVVATSSQHALGKLSDDGAVRFEKGKLDRDVMADDKVAIQYNPEKSQVYEQGKEPTKDQARGTAMDFSR